MTEDTRIDLYTRDNCAFCARAKDLLAAKYVTWREIDITGNDRAAAPHVTDLGSVSNCCVGPNGLSYEINEGPHFCWNIIRGNIDSVQRKGFQLEFR